MKASTSGKDIFTANCGSCHTLKDAGTSGNVGPNLDQLKPSLEIVQKQVTNGGGAMPAFKGTLTAAQIMAVAKYVSSVAGRARKSVAEVHHDVVDRHRVALARARDDASLQPVRAALGMRRDHDLVGAEGAERVLHRLQRVTVADLAARLHAVALELGQAAVEPLAAPAPAPESSSEARWRSGVFSAGLTTSTRVLPCEASCLICSSSGSPPTVSFATTRIRRSPSGPLRTGEACTGAARLTRAPPPPDDGDAQHDEDHQAGPGVDHAGDRDQGEVDDRAEQEPKRLAFAPERVLHCLGAACGAAVRTREHSRVRLK